MLDDARLRMHVSVHCRMSPTAVCCDRPMTKSSGCLEVTLSFGGRSEPCRRGPTTLSSMVPQLFWLLTVVARRCIRRMRSLSALRRLVSWCSGARQTPITERYVMFRKVRQPSLIVPGVKDIVVEPVNAVVLDENLSDARLLML